MNPVNNVNVFTTEVSGMTAVTLRSVTATRAPHGVLVRWRTAAETDVLGFNVYRELNGKRVRINPKPIAAANTSAGRTYSYLDRKSPRGKAVRYWIQGVNADGSRDWYGPARIRPTT